MVINLLTELKCLVDYAESGEQGLIKVQNNTYDLIYMDIGLPDMDGITVCKKKSEN